MLVKTVNTYITTIEREINKVIEKYSNYELIDIKYCYLEDRIVSALLIFKD